MRIPIRTSKQNELMNRGCGLAPTHARYMFANTCM